METKYCLNIQSLDDHDHENEYQMYHNISESCYGRIYRTLK